MIADRQQRPFTPKAQRTNVISPGSSGSRERAPTNRLREEGESISLKGTASKLVFAQVEASEEWGPKNFKNTLLATNDRCAQSDHGEALLLDNQETKEW